MKILPIAIGAGAIYFLVRSTLNAGSALQRLTFGNPKVKVKNLTLLNMELAISLDITNPGTADVALDYFTGIISYQGKQLSNFTFNANGKNTIIKGRQITTVPFTVLVKNVAAVSTMVKLIEALASGKKLSTVVEINGSLFAAGFDVPVNFFYDVKNNVVVPAPGVSGVKAQLEFSSNAEMEKYFFNRKAAKKIAFSKN